MMRRIADQSFNCITIDGDTSTNDSFIVMTSGASGVACKAGSIEFSQLEAGLVAVAQELAQLIVRDGEGVFTKIHPHRGECRLCRRSQNRVAWQRRAFPWSKPRFSPATRIWGASSPPSAMRRWTDWMSTPLTFIWTTYTFATAGGRHPSYTEEQGQAVMNQAEITVRIVLNRGSANANVWTCDLSHDYVSINADYRS